jgi:uncharacterized membrane protein
MSKLIPPGRIIYAVGIIALGILCIISKDFIVGRPPAWPAGFDVNPALADISGTALILAGMAILAKKKAGLAALLIALFIFLLSVLRHLPLFMNDWLNAFKSMALLGGTLIVASSVFEEDSAVTSTRRVDERLRKRLVLTGYLLLGIFFIVCGYAHFIFAAFVKDLIPGYMPFHAFWTYFCGICLFAGGAGLLLPQTRKWAALLSGIMVFGWFLLLHIPRFLGNMHDPSDRMGLCESFTFAGIFFVLAGLVSEKE